MIWSFALFSVIPVPIRGELTRDKASRALRYISLVGLILGALASLPLIIISALAPGAQFLGAILTVGLLALLTRGLHLDGLADAADGLGANKTPSRALEIMRQSDIGPFGVITLIVVLGAQAVALNTMTAVNPFGGVFSPVASFGWTAYAPLSETGGTFIWTPFIWTPLVALAVAAAIGRSCSLIAARTSIPPARKGGFGALVAASQGPVSVLLTVVLTIVGVGAAAILVGQSPWSWAIVAVIALVVTTLFLRHLVRRFGGVTGDVFGAVIELGMTISLGGFAIVAAAM